VIERLGVVIPAHNEAALLPACLDSVLGALEAVDLPVRVVVALDRCSDDSAAVTARYPWVTAVTIDAGNVGAARAAAAAAVLEWSASTPRDRVWVATTDADSTVPVDWIARHCTLANDGWEVVLGTVDVLDWTGHATSISGQWAAGYAAVEDHPHIHGANFGCTASAYLAAGGWRPLALDEDVALAAALAHRRVIRTALIPVVTSARRDPRAKGGFGDTLRALAG
jgi:glycosyltransferase involved in cell wall biosynthesis